MARVAHGEHGIRARHNLDVGLSIAFIEFDVGGFDGESASLRHRVPRIDGEVHDDLVDLPRVDLDRAEVGRQSRRELDILADQTLKQFSRVNDDGVEIDDPRFRAPVWRLNARSWRVSEAARSPAP